MRKLKNVHPDAKGRITLGALVKNVSVLSVSVDRDQRIILEPLAEIPLREKWLFENKAALSKVAQGINEARAGKITKKDFSKYLKE